MHLIVYLESIDVCPIKSVRRDVQYPGYFVPAQEAPSMVPRYMVPRNEEPVVLGTVGTRNRWCTVPQQPGTMVLGTQEPITTGARYPSNQEPVVLGTQQPGTGGCLVPQQPGTSGAQYPRNQEPVVHGTPLTQTPNSGTMEPLHTLPHNNVQKLNI